MAGTKTVGDGSQYDPLYLKQQRDVSEMRASLLTCSDDITNTTTALKNITILRVYHQVSRIIRYLDMMDKIEDKLYRTMDNTLLAMDEYDEKTMIALLTVQEKLQKTMLESHKLLQPYLTLETFSIVDQVDAGSTGPTSAIMNSESRNKLRNNAQQVLLELNTEAVNE